MMPKLYHLHALSALHCGTGQSAGVVDLPIARDRATNLPLVPGSSLRGVLRDEFAGHADAETKKLEKTLFGPRRIDGNDNAHAGALSVGDAHLLLLPIRALAGIVAYATCPFILKRYARDLDSTAPSVPIPQIAQAMHTADNVNIVAGKVVLEDIDLTPETSVDVEPWAELIAQAAHPDDETARTDLKQRFLILPDSIFSYLVETATEIRARIAIDPDKGTVKTGALWYEENLPAETLLWGIYALSKSRVTDETLSADELTQKIPANLLLQLGGKAGVGRGLTRFLNGGGR